ncbi:hypothetical protein BC835DRAFT_1309732 [Cytidiella melzeri]|nr:hypothetical protein BC835DRAFT_1309732 [Cytidiella melzeri]
MTLRKEKFAVQTSSDWFELRPNREELVHIGQVQFWFSSAQPLSVQDWVTGDGDELPESFFVAPKNVHMPDLTAVAEVLLGKLGYGTVSECVDACTPFVYVPRPLFIEEHGLRLLLDKEGVSVELSRSTYEAGDWAAAVQEAYDKGKACKAEKRREGETGRVAVAGKKMAAELVNWVKAAKG